MKINKIAAVIALLCGFFSQAIPALEVGITANGARDGVTAREGSLIGLQISLNPGNHRGAPADWWAAAATPFGLFWYTVESGWIPSTTPVPAYSGPLVKVVNYSIYSGTQLPLGNYTIYFGVDLVQNGQLDIDPLYYRAIPLAVIGSGAVTSMPDDALWCKEIIRNSLPQDFRTVIAWFEAVTVSNKHNDSMFGEATVVVDYQKLIEQCPGKPEKILDSQHYNDVHKRKLAWYEGGRYLRTPWFGGNDYHEQMYNAWVSGGALTIMIGQTPERVAHWWTKRVHAMPGCSYFGEMRLKIAGLASVQFGSDWWRDENSQWNGYDTACKTSNSCEAWVSGWYGDTGGQFVTIRTPLFNQPPVISRLLGLSSNDKQHVVKCEAIDYDEQKNLTYDWIIIDGGATTRFTTMTDRISFTAKDNSEVFCRVIDTAKASVMAGPLVIGQ